MRFTMITTWGFACVTGGALAIACQHQGYDSGSANLTSGTYDAPPPRPTASPGPTDYMSDKATAPTATKGAATREPAPRAALSTWGAASAPSSDARDDTRDVTDRGSLAASTDAGADASRPPGRSLTP